MRYLTWCFLVASFPIGIGDRVNELVMTGSMQSAYLLAISCVVCAAIYVLEPRVRL